MEEQTTWRGHGFTLFVFGGIVFLCATFFVLGMLVGRSQGQKYASANAADTTKTQTAADKPDFDTLTELKKDEPPAPVLVAPPNEDPAPSETQAPDTQRDKDPVVTHSTVNIQVGAMAQHSAAVKLVSEMKKLGFKALILPPSANDKDAYYRVQVGPFEDAPEAESARQKLQSAGYRAIIKK
jgi:cell division protein FtsN